MMNTEGTQWARILFRHSVLKQQKYLQVTTLLGSTDSLTCLDIGAGNGVISYLLRLRGGTWKSADLNNEAIRVIHSLVGTEVYRIDGGITPFKDAEFDRIVIVDFLEHIREDSAFIRDLSRIMKPGGILIVNVPHLKCSPLRTFRQVIGQTDEKRGHVRPGYSIERLREVLGDYFEFETHNTYSRFFTQCVDTLILLALSLAKGHPSHSDAKGIVVTEQDLNTRLFKLYSLLYAGFWLCTKLDSLLFATSGYRLIVRARVTKGWRAVHKDEAYVAHDGHALSHNGSLPASDAARGVARWTQMNR